MDSLMMDYPSGVEFRVVDVESGQEVPWDNKTFGELQVRGPWIARAYYNDQDSAAKFDERRQIRQEGPAQTV